jgi:hypothetical protein
MCNPPCTDIAVSGKPDEGLATSAAAFDQQLQVVGHEIQ